MTKTVIETALDEELSEHLGHDRHDPVGRFVDEFLLAPFPPVDTDT